jgi:hypothetical protein
MNLHAIFLHTLWKGLDRHVANRAALRYITEYFQPSHKRHPRSVYSLKHDFEQLATRYINEADYSQCLRQCGLKVVDGKVFAKEKPC